MNLFVIRFKTESGQPLDDTSRRSRWNVLQVLRGTFGADDCINEVAEIKFDKPIPIKPNVRYAVKLRNRGAQYTLSGDNGTSKVKCADGTTFTFSGCAASTNGTSHFRGQIPKILYYRFAFAKYLHDFTKV